MKQFRVLRTWPTILLATAVVSCTDEQKIMQPSTDVSPQMTTVASLPPVANPGGPYTGFVKTNIKFDGRGSSDPDGAIADLTYAWKFGDGGSGTGATPSHAYAATGTYTLTLTVKDKSGALSAPASTTVTVQPPNQAP